jgi:hypothetical protein
MRYCNNYSALGNSCISHTIAIPSNTKFLPRYDNVYDMKYTKTLYYPGHEEDKVLNTSNKTNIIDKIKYNIQDKKCTNC